MDVDNNRFEKKRPTCTQAEIKNFCFVTCESYSFLPEIRSLFSGRYSDLASSAGTSSQHFTNDVVFLCPHTQKR